MIELPWLHPRRALLAAAENRLSPPERARLDRHLARCRACRLRLARLERAVVGLAASPVETAAPALDLRALVSPNDRHDATRAARAPLRWLAAAGAGLAIATAVGLLGRERVEIRRASGPLAPFEALALAEHARLAGSAPALALESGSAAEIRRWLTENGAFSAALVTETRPAAGPEIALLGVRAAAAGAGRGGAVAARIDGKPVTLLAGHAAEVEGLPSWSLFGKTLQVRRDPESGAHLLSWKNAGKAYTLVTDPALPPALACQLCHVAPRRLATIARVAAEL